MLDEEEDNFADVAAFGDAPVLENGGAHRAVFLQDVVAESEQELVAANVTLLVAGFLSEAVDGKVESLSHQKVGSGLEAFLFLNN